MAKHLPNKLWEIRKDGDSNGMVKTIDSSKIQIYYYANINDPSTIIEFNINRTDARMLAKRILECLDKTK